MKFAYKVHSVSTEEVDLDVESNGKPLRVKASALVIEIVSEDGSMSHTLRKIGATEKEADGFEVGAVINGNFTVAK